MVTQTLARSQSEDVSTYALLKNRVRQVFVLGRQKIEAEKINTYWQAGRYIHTHILEHNHRADYGKHVMGRLSKDLLIDVTVLRKITQFYRAFPIRAARRELTWAHYRALMSVDDSAKREDLVEKAAREKWTSRELEIKIRNLHWQSRSEENKTLLMLKPPSLGPFYTYRVIRPELVHSVSNELLVDLGFSTALELNRLTDKNIRPDTVIASAKDAKGRYSVRPAKGLGPEYLYTYQAFVERVIDGDTLKVEIDLGFNIRIRQTIRLKSMDAAELDTAKGRDAKKFVESRLKNRAFITIKTTKSDKYDRYLGDVFVGDGGDAQHLNQLLINEGLAVKVSE